MYGCMIAATPERGVMVRCAEAGVPMFICLEKGGGVWRERKGERGHFCGKSLAMCSQ